MSRFSTISLLVNSVHAGVGWERGKWKRNLHPKPKQEQRRGSQRRSTGPACCVQQAGRPFSSLRLHEATARLPPAGSTAEASENAVLRRLGVLQAGCRVCPLLPTWQEMEPSPWAAWRRTSAKNITAPFPRQMVWSQARPEFSTSIMVLT